MSGRVCSTGRRWVCVAILVATTSLFAAPRAWAQPAPTRVSVDAGGAQADGASRNPSVSGDGRYVAFESKATNLVPGDTNGSSDIFVKDRWTGAIERVSVKTGGAEAIGDSVTPRLSPDARYVVFSSRAPLGTMPAHATCNNVPCSEIYLHDRTTGETTLVTVPTTGTQSDGDSTNPSISADGRYVTFLSRATNLIAGGNDTNAHVYLRDRTAGTTAWLDRRSNGLLGPPASGPPVISNDGSTVAFTWYGPNGVPPPGGDAPCNDQPAGHCIRVFLFDRPTATLSRLPLAPDLFSVSAGFGDVQAGAVALSADGRRVATQLLATQTPSGSQTPQTNFYAIVQDRVTGHVINVPEGPAGTGSNAFLALDATARMIATCRPSIVNGGQVNVISMLDLVASTGAGQPVSAVSVDCAGLALSGNGQVLTLGSSTALIGGDTNAQTDVYAYDLDTDHDGMPDAWETLYGFNPSDPADAALDADGDGATNLEEYRASTHPRGAFTRYLAEGAQNAFFGTDIALCAPHGANVLVRYLGDSGAVRTVPLTLSPPFSGFSCPGAFAPVAGVVPDASFSTVIESDTFVAVERTMHWGSNALDGSNYGSSAETGIVAPSTTWYFAEGATHGAFDLFYLLQNTSDTATIATITYLLPGGLAPIVRDYDLAAHSRRTIWVDQEPGLAATDVSAKIVAGVPILAERSMYLSTPDQPFAGGTGGAGIPQPATKWFVAEGATGAFFDLYLLIGNPSTEDANVTVSYLLDNGTTFDKSYVVGKESRLTISVKDQDPRLAAVSVSSVITSTNNVPIVVERSMWWPSPGWYEGHLTAGTTETATSWVLADGRAGARDDTRVYVLVANPSDTLAHVTFNLGGPNDFSARLPVFCQRTVDVAPHSRYTADIRAMCLLDQNQHASANWIIPLAGTVTSDGPGIIVERSTYATTGGQFWSQGSSTALSKVPTP